MKEELYSFAKKFALDAALVYDRSSIHRKLFLWFALRKRDKNMAEICHFLEELSSVAIKDVATIDAMYLQRESNPPQDDLVRRVLCEQ